MILVTHDLGVVADIADRIVVMYAGRVVEQGTLDEIFYDPQHPYTWGLLGSITRVDRDRSQRLQAIPGQPPSLLSPPQGCHFRPRCPFAFEKCTEVPELTSRLPESPEHLDRCWLEVEQKRTAARCRRRIGLRDRGDGDLVSVLRDPQAETPSPRDGRPAARGRAPEDAVPDQVGRARRSQDRPGPRRRRRLLRAPRGRDARDRRRVGVRQDDADPDAGAAARSDQRLRSAFAATDITHVGRQDLEAVRREMQMVFQDPQASLNPRKRVVQILATPLQHPRRAAETGSRRRAARCSIASDCRPST